MRQAYVASGADGDEEGVAEKLELKVTSRLYAGDDASVDDATDPTGTAGYSIKAIDHHEDFRRIPHQAFPTVVAALQRIARKHAAIPRREFKPAKRGRTMDFRASMRESRK